MRISWIQARLPFEVRLQFGAKCVYTCPNSHAMLTPSDVLAPYVLTCADARELARVRITYRSQGFTLRVHRSQSFVGQFVANVWDPSGEWVGTFESFQLPALSEALRECISVPRPFAYKPPPVPVELPFLPGDGSPMHWRADLISGWVPLIACFVEGMNTTLPAYRHSCNDAAFGALLASPSLHGRACKVCARAFDENLAL